MAKHLTTNCPICGEEFPTQARFCRNCGQELHPSSKQVPQSPNARSNHVFISYSRKQFYFAESLMLQLDKQGVPVWFDMQQLAPGATWQQRIDQGLSSCTALVLIASRAALTSDYVRREWQTVLAANKPVYVVLFEAVHLPPELQSAAIIDMRIAFANKVKVLAEAIRQQTFPRDRLPLANPLQFPTRLPLSVSFILGILWLITVLNLAFTAMLIQVFLAITQPNSMDLPGCALSLFGITFHGFPQTIYPFLTVAAASLLVTISSVVIALALLYRRHFPYALLHLVLFSPLICFVSSLLLKDWTGHINSSNSSSLGSASLSVGSAMILYFDHTFTWLILFALVSAIFGLSAFLVARHSSALLRWLPTGTAPERLRLKQNSVWGWSDSIPQKKELQAQNQEEAKGKSWFLLFDPTEYSTAQEVKTALRRRNYLREETDVEADIYIALLNRHTKVVWLDVLVRTVPHLICIICTSIHIPKSLGQLRQNQWFDYRGRSSEKIKELADHLEEGGLPTRRYTFPAIPEGFEQTIVPKPIWYQSHAIRLIVTFIAATIVFSGGVSTRSDFPAPPVEVIFGLLAPILYYLGLVACVYLFWLASRLILCSISYHGFRRQFNLAMFVVFTAQFQFLGYFTSDPGLLFFGGLMTVALIATWRILDPSILQAWLPARSTPMMTRDKTLAVPAWQQLWPSTVLYLFLFVASIFLSRIFFAGILPSSCL